MSVNGDEEKHDGIIHLMMGCNFELKNLALGNYAIIQRRAMCMGVDTTPSCHPWDCQPNIDMMPQGNQILTLKTRSNVDINALHLPCQCKYIW